MTFRIKVFHFDSLVDFTLPFEEAKRVIGYFALFESIEQIWIFDGNNWQEQISDAN